MKKWVYGFSESHVEGGRDDAAELGGKGANLAEMCRLGLPVPPGLTIVSDACHLFHESGKQLPEEIKAEVLDHLQRLSAQTGRRFGDVVNPLLVSVRSGSRVSMPGMMDTVLNLGLNDDTVEALAQSSGNARFAWDSYRRFIQMYGDVVLGLDGEAFEEVLSKEKERRGVELDTEMTAADWKSVVSAYKALIEEELEEFFPQSVEEQLWGAIGAVFASWKNRRATTFRILHNIPEEWGTAVTIQAMVFGNLGETSATGIAFTRSPATGENRLFGEFLLNAQGEDIVAGIRTPQNLLGCGEESSPSLGDLLPEAFAHLLEICARLEAHFCEMQDLEFTIERGKLWMLQTRTGKRTTVAALKIAVDMVSENLISAEEAMMRIEPMSLDQLLHPQLDPDAAGEVMGIGLPASPGAAMGAIVFTSEEAVAAKAEGRKAILVRVETSPEDVHGMHAAQGILTIRGGMTSHAAVVARGMGIPCVVGAGNMRVDVRNGLLLGLGTMLRKGDIITLDGATGRVYSGEVAMVQPELSEDFRTLMTWADRVRRMRVRTNVDTPADARVARSFGAEGIGLCRTERMFFEGDRLRLMREMILAEGEAGRRAALEKLLPIQRSDFMELFVLMHGLPVTIRLLDPPLHEFLPKSEQEIHEVAAAMHMQPAALRQRVDALHEANPMLGHRGCRLAVSYPEILEMQARAVFEAAVLAARETGAVVVPEIMVPLVGLRTEMDFVKDRVAAVAKAVMAEAGMDIRYLVGALIELPRACLRANIISEAADFLSFGTNDLTQTTYGISRDDAAAFIPTYQRKGMLERDPFVSLDLIGVGELIGIAVERGRRTRQEILLAICGEHAGDPASIRFCESLGLDYVSCSPFRVPIARLAAAQAALLERPAA